MFGFFSEYRRNAPGNGCASRVHPGAPALPRDSSAQHNGLAPAPRRPAPAPGEPALLPLTKREHGERWEAEGGWGVGCRSRDGRCWRWGGHWAVPGWLRWSGPIRAGCREVWRDDVHGVRTGGSLGHAPPLLARSPPHHVPSPVPPHRSRLGCRGQGHRAGGGRVDGTPCPPLLPKWDQDGWVQGSHHIPAWAIPG